jgi:p-cumate 2,3-dioxygenase beta subunit
MSDLAFAGALSRYDAETFLYHEAALLDNWKLSEWANLFTDDGEYLIPPLDDPDGQPGSALFLVLDDRHRLGERANRLLKRNAHAEFPHAKTRRLVSNVDVQDGADGTVRATCNFVVYRSRAGSTEIFPGHGIYDLRIESPGSVKIRRKRAIIDTDSLRSQGRVSIIL